MNNSNEKHAKMNRTKLKEIIKFSFYKNMQNKWFIIFNLITLISIVVSLNWGSISGLFTSSTEPKIFTIAMLDNANLVYDDFITELQDTPDLEITKITENTYTAENIPDNFAIVEIIPDDLEAFKTSIISKEGISTLIYTPVKDALFNIRNKHLAKMYQIKSDELLVLQSDLSVNRVMLSVNAEDSNAKEMIKLFSSALTYILTIMIFSKMANEIAQEKQSKSSEYILTTVSAKEYLFAKIFSNIAVLIIQGLLLFVYYFIAVSFSNIINIAATDISLSADTLTSKLSLDTVVYILALIGYSVLNLILLCIVQATLSAKTASTAEASNTVSLLVFIMMAAYIATVYVITPYTKVSGLLYVISCLPVLSAYFVPAMMVIGQANLWQIIISLLLLIVSIPLTFNFCSKIFKNGILDYTKVKKKVVKEVNKDAERKKFLVKREMRNVGFVVGIAILLYIGLQNILALLCSFVLPTLLKDVFTSSEINLIMQMALQSISLGLCSAFVFAYCNKNENLKFTKTTAPKLNFEEKTKIVLIALFLIAVFQVLLSFTLYPKIGLDYDITSLFNVTADSSMLTKIIFVLTLAVVPGIFEELFFRKALIDFTRPYGKIFALIFSSLLFGMLHLNASQGLFAFIVGLIFGIIYLYTNDIKLTMLIHFINNGFGAITMVLPTLEVFIVTILLFGVLIAGFVFFIMMLANKSSRNKMIGFLKRPVALEKVKNKYKYIFTDFTFDVSLILIVVMTIFTENILR